MKLRLIVLFSLLLIAAVVAWAVSNSILYQLPSVAATPICNTDLGCAGGVTGYTFAGAGSGTNCSPQDPCDGAFTLSPRRHQDSPHRSLPHDDRYRQPERDLVRQLVRQLDHDWHLRVQGARLEDPVHDRPGDRRHQYTLSDGQRVERSCGPAR